MIYRGKAILSSKLAKQLKDLERKPECVSFGQMLDAVAERIYAPAKPRCRRSNV